MKFWLWVTEEPGWSKKYNVEAKLSIIFGNSIWFRPRNTNFSQLLREVDLFPQVFIQKQWKRALCFEHKKWANFFYKLGSIYQQIFNFIGKKLCFAMSKNTSTEVSDHVKKDWLGISSPAPVGYLTAILSRLCFVYVTN